MTYKCYDTCSLLKQAGHLFETNDYTLVISSIVLEELENIKTSANKDADVKCNARRVLRDLDEHPGAFEIILYNDVYGDKNSPGLLQKVEQHDKLLTKAMAYFTIIAVIVEFCFKFYFHGMN